MKAIQKVIFNDDAQMLEDIERGRAKQSLIQLIDRIIDHVPIDTYTILCANPDICEYETKVGEVRGRRFDQPPDRRAAGIDALREEGTDILSVYAEYLHQRGIRCLPEVRMNDTHHMQVSRSVAGCPMITIEHPEWIIPRHDGVVETALDYSFPEVRAHRLAIMRELVTNYDVDGLELNFNRWAKHFERSKGREKVPIMTEYIGQIRAMLDDAAKQRGRDRLSLMVWMPSTVEECREAGCDIQTWVEREWVDEVVVAEYNNTWPGTQVEQFASFCRGRCDVYVQMGNQNGGTLREPRPRMTGRGPYQSAKRGPGYSGMLLTPAEARGAAANFSSWGAQGVAFWNIACTTGERSRSEVGSEHRARMFEWMNEVIDPDRLWSNERRYHYIPLYKGIGPPPIRSYAVHAEGHSPAGACKGQVLTFDHASMNQRQAFAFRMADGRQGQPLNGDLRFRVLYAPLDNRLQVDINGVVVSPDRFQIDQDVDNADMQARWYKLDLRHCPPLAGNNELGFVWDGPLCDPPSYVEELDVVVR